MMGGGSGSGGMLRSVGRAVRAAGVSGVGETISTTTAVTNRATHHKNTTSTTLSLASASLSSSTHPISASSTSPTSHPAFSHPDDWDWEPLDLPEEGTVNGSLFDCVFGSVPSEEEAQTALSALQQVLEPSHSDFIKDRFAYNSGKNVSEHITIPTTLMHRVSSVGSDLDWKEPSPRLCNPTILQNYGSDRVYDAFHLLQADPSVQRMVISLSSDKAVWDAVLSNEVVRELRESFYGGENNSLQEGSDETTDASDAAKNILGWIFDSSKAKVMDLIDKITKIVNMLFQPQDSEQITGATANPFNEKLRSSFMISVMVLLIVVVARARRA